MAIHTFTDRKDSSPEKPNSTDDNPLLDFDIPEIQRTLKLAGLLQTSLEVESILQFFSETVHETVPFSSLEYVSEKHSLTFETGKADRHSCSYRLKIAGDELGEMKFTRNKRFDEKEMEEIENFIYHLVYPLRNSILYRTAVLAAQIDSLTGINNRESLDRNLAREVELAHRHEHELSLLILDIDFFKNVNDNYGHSAGDVVLQSVVKRIIETMRTSDIIFRYGGEEFALLLTGTDLEGARYVGERLRNAIANYPFMYNGKELSITASIGVATLGRRDGAKRVFNNADAALYQAKKAGRNQVHSYSGTRKGR